MRFSSAEISFSTPWSIDFSCLADWKLEGFMGLLGVVRVGLLWGCDGGCIYGMGASDYIIIMFLG